MQEYNKKDIERQINVCNKIINRIKSGQYLDASILIRYYLNNNGYKWYKNIDSIINDQLSNLFLDIEQEFKNNYTIDFFNGIIKGLLFDIKHGYL